MKVLSIVILLALVLSGCAGSNISSSSPASFPESEILESEVSTASANSIDLTSQSSEMVSSANNEASAVSSQEQTSSSSKPNIASKDTTTVAGAVSSIASKPNTVASTTESKVVTTSSAPNKDENASSSQASSLPSASSKPIYSQSENEGTNLYTDAPANTKQEKMTILNGRFELKLPQPSKVVNFHNEDACLYAVLEYSPKDYKKIIDKKLISNNFDCLGERREGDYNIPSFFDPIYKPLKRESWWDISLNSNVVLSYTYSIDLIKIVNKKQLNNNKVEMSMIQTPSGIRTAIYVVKTKKNTYKFYCALESSYIYSQSENEGTNLYTDAPANTKQEKMTILNGRFELKLPQPSKVVNFNNEDACLYAVLEYSPKDYKKIIDKKLISNNFDCLGERREGDYNIPSFFDPIYKPLKRESWWDISLNSNVVLSYSKRVSLVISPRYGVYDIVSGGMSTAIYVVKTKKNTYKFYCALESYALYSGERKDTTLPLPLADSDSLTPTYVSYPQKSEKDKMYIIEHRTQNMKKLPEPISVDNFYNDTYCMYACLTYDEKAIDEIFNDEDRNIGLDILAPSLEAAEETITYSSKEGVSKEAKIHSLFRPLANLPWWNFSIDEIEKCSTSTIMIFDFYEPTDRIDKSTCRLPSGEKVMPMRVSGDGHTFYVAIKDGENYKLYISHENESLYEMHLNGTLLPGTYGK